VKRSHLIIGGTMLLLALAALGIVGIRVLAHDRHAIHVEHARDKMHRLEEAALELGNDVEKIGEDLELAAALVSQAGTAEVSERELHAIATITREYLAFDVRGAGLAPLRVVAPDSHPEVLARASAVVEDTARLALASPGTLQTSPPLGAQDDETEWYRVFARASPTIPGLVVALIVDMRPLLSRLRLLEDHDSALLVIGAHGRPAPSSDPVLADAVRGLAGRERELPALTRLLAAVEARGTPTEMVDEAEAARLGLPAAAAVGVAVPVLIEDGAAWALALVSSTVALRTQERVLVQRMVIGAGLGVALLTALAVYFVWNARRAAALRERVRQADRFAHAEKLATAGQLAAGIAHEIGTPLNIVRGRAELTLARLGADHGQAASQQVIVDQIDHVSRLISQLLDYVQPRPEAREAVDAAAAIRSTVELLVAESTKRKVRVLTELGDTLPQLRAAAGPLQQVLVNLTMNALDACEAGGTVVLRAQAARGGEAIVLEVEDDGVGIPDERRAQVFDPFFTTKKRGKGTGLGLWVVAQLVQTHGGEIDLRSVPGSGTTFRVTWPAHAAEVRPR
jgi:signal transduction histidine kinase